MKTDLNADFERDIVSADYSRIERRIEAFIQEKAPVNGVVVGVSGGIDSALVLTLCVVALGADRVRALLMPETEADVNASIQNYIRQLGVDQELIPISSILGTYERDGRIAADRVVTGNLKARIRMALLYSRSNAYGLVVMGTGNRSELLTGYFTKYGDGGVDYLPIGDLYKTHVRQLARRLKVPADIIAQPPSAELWAGQTDEQELGLSYDTLDRVLYAHTDRQVPFADIAIPGVSQRELELVQKRLETNSFKSESPPICSVRT